MFKIWICFGFLATFGVLGHADYIPKGMDAFDDYSEEMDKNYPDSDEDNNDQDKLIDINDPDSFKIIEDENGHVIYDEAYDDVVKTLSNGTVEGFDVEPLDGNNNREDIDDYQVEDNRSAVKDDKQEFEEIVDDSDIGQKKADIELESDVTDKKSTKMVDISQNSKDYVEELLKQEASEDVGDNIGDDIHSWERQLVEANEEDELVKEDDYDFQDKNAVDHVLDQESHMILLNETQDTDEDLADEGFADLDDNQHFIIEETNRILEETNEDFDEEINENGVENENFNNTTTENNEMPIVNNSSTENDSNIYAESNEALNHEIVEGKDSKIETTTDENIKKFNASSGKLDIDEDTVAEAYSDLIDDLNQLHQTWIKLKDDVSDASLSKENLPGFEELDSKFVDMAQEVEEKDYEEIDVKDLSKLFKPLRNDESEVDNDVDEMVEEEADEVEPELTQPEQDNSDIASQGKTDKPNLIKYVDDALIASEPVLTPVKNPHDDVEPTTSTDSGLAKFMVQEHKVELMKEIPVDLINIFSSDEEEPKAADPVRITLDIDEPVVLISPMYPNPYPSNAVLEWILEGEGTGIEFNVTDFGLNSAAGDYVMIKPGRVDSSGEDGIILSHTLSSPRSFRFLNVDRMFIRFESMQGVNSFQGFRFSVKMIMPLVDEDTSEPGETPIDYPHSSITLNLGGITVDRFIQVQEEFRQLVADMATMYIEANQIEPGLNTTRQVTQITSAALCFHNWPQFERCAEVRFGVPLQYVDEEAEPRLNEDDLRNMWYTYSDQNPFALRLQELGITDFHIPNDSRVLMVWLVIAAGVVISMAMLAFALWRFSCFEDYTRMPAFSDTESIAEKKTLDLYPTPHQTLPPLYADSDYKWGELKYEDTTRVDLSGFANRSYVRSDDYGFDSDEDAAVPARDRYTTDV